MGTIEPGQKCATCGNRVGACPGHFGHIELARPVVHVGHAKLLLKMLRGICHACGRVLLTDEQSEEYYETQANYKEIFDKPDEVLIKEIFKTSRKSQECPFCAELVGDLKSHLASCEFAPEDASIADIMPSKPRKGKKKSTATSGKDTKAKQACPYCKKEFIRLGRHITSCPQRPKDEDKEEDKS